MCVCLALSISMYINISLALSFYLCNYISLSLFICTFLSLSHISLFLLAYNFYQSDHFECITEAISFNQGTIDKFIGDSVMAFWGAPVWN